MKTSFPILNPETLRHGADQAVAALKLLANADRMLLLCQLSHGEMCVSELEAQLAYVNEWGGELVLPTEPPVVG